MGRLLICTGRYAQTPYYLNAVCMNVYSVEELCYLFSLNPFIITTDILDDSLITWLSDECGLTDLSEELREKKRKGCQISEYVDIILNYVNYCSPEEIASIDETLHNTSGLSEYERRMRQADYLLRNGKFEAAVDEYEAIDKSLPEVEGSLRPIILHNIGFCYANLFMFDVSARYFKKAYEMTKMTDSGLMYLASMRLYLSPEKYINFISKKEELKELSLKLEKKMNEAEGAFEASDENRMLSALSIYKDEGNVADYYEEIDKVILKLKEDYISMVVN